MKKDIIAQVREAEDRAERTLHKAQTDTDTIVRDARRQAVERRQKILEHARQEAKQRFESGAKAIEPDIAKIHQQSEGEMTSDTQHANEQFEAAVEFVVNRFHEQFGNG